MDLKFQCFVIICAIGIFFEMHIRQNVSVQWDRNVDSSLMPSLVLHVEALLC
jgi:hypothetical protein